LEGHSREVHRTGIGTSRLCPSKTLTDRTGIGTSRSHQLHTRRYCSSKKYFTIWVSQKYICDNLLWIDHQTENSVKIDCPSLI
jgi:hypothetical protein